MAEVPPDGPAQRAGLRVGDSIVSVDGRSVADLSSQEVQKLLSGEVGSTAVLEVLRDGERRTLEIAREPYATKGDRP